MDFKLVSKNNMGVVATLILVILLSQSKFFNFLIDNALGRAFLIFFIIVISFVNKILGVVAVLFIIIMFNQSRIGFYEGFTTPNGKTNGKTNGKPNNKLQQDKNKLNELKEKEKQAKQNASTTAAISSATTTTPSNGIEGFNTIDREGVILRGKRSSEMPVLPNTRNQSDNIEPTDMSVFTNSFSSF
jgi:hypothetical protein